VGGDGGDEAFDMEWGIGGGGEGRMGVWWREGGVLALGKGGDEGGEEGGEWDIEVSAEADGDGGIGAIDEVGGVEVGGEAAEIEVGGENAEAEDELGIFHHGDDFGRADGALVDAEG
jgi:hypothetical protein